jgi:hypothetical protein
MQLRSMFESAEALMDRLSAERLDLVAFRKSSMAKSQFAGRF